MVLWFNREAALLASSTTRRYFAIRSASSTDRLGQGTPARLQLRIVRRTSSSSSRMIWGSTIFSAFGGGVADGRVTTPGIDALAKRGVSFRQAYAGTASCAPSRAMMMTGRYPARDGFRVHTDARGMGKLVVPIAAGMSKQSGLPPPIYDADAASRLPPYERQGLPGSEVTIAEVLRGAGYHTVHIGKWHTGLGPEFGPNAQGSTKR